MNEVDKNYYREKANAPEFGIIVSEDAGVIEQDFNVLVSAYNEAYSQHTWVSVNK